MPGVLLITLTLMCSVTLMSLQALYAQNSWFYPFIIQYLQHDSIIIPTYSITLPTLDNTTDFCIISHPHTDTILNHDIYTPSMLFYPSQLTMHHNYHIPS